MGLKDKIKGALHPEREEGYADNEHNSKYDSKHGTTATDGHGHAYDATHQDTKYGRKYDTGRTNADTTADYGYGHRKADSGVDFGSQPYSKDEGINRTNPTNTTTSTTSNTQPEYWGNMGQGRNSPPRKTDTLDSYGTDDRSRLHKNLPLRPDQQTAAANSRFDDTRYDSRGHTGATGGTYNTVAGAGSPGYDSRLHDRDLGRDNRGTMGTAGVAGAGIAANQAYDRDARYNDLQPSQQHQPGGGVPQTSMLDPYQTGPGVSNNNTRAGPHDSNLANKMDPRVDSDLDRGNNSRLPGNNQSRLGAGTGATAAAGMGPDHFGPGHEGAKVVHTCVGCGLDNDISQYFRKDATYRMN